LSDLVVKSIKDLAKLADCSISTVSKALNGRPDVSEETRQRVLKIAQDHTFVPSASGKALKRKCTENIGVVFCRDLQPLSGNPFYSRVLEGIEAQLAINNYNLILQLQGEDDKAALPKMLREKRVDGIILVGVLNQAFVERVRSIQIPTVLIDPKIFVEDLNQVLIDNEHGAFEATQYLINNGHKRIGFISGDLDRMSFRQRYDGYRKALAYNEIIYDDRLIQTGGAEMGFDHVAQLMRLKVRPTAIFSANDINAIYGYKAAKDLQLQIPGDVSFIGFDDIELATKSSPPLTTIRVYKEELGSIAVRNLLEGMNDPSRKPITTCVPTRLIERESVLKKNIGQKV
jgi:LacI family transcriptional regulator